MTSAYPSGLDSFVTDIDGFTLITAAESNNQNASIVALEKWGYPVVNVIGYGGVADGATDNTAALASALSALPSSGGTILFPAAASAYQFASALNLTGKNFVRLIGAGPSGSGGGNTASFIRITSTTGPLIACGSTTSVELEGLYIQWPAAFTGTVLDFSGTTFARCARTSFFANGGGSNAAVLISLDDATRAIVERSVLHNAQVGIQGIATGGHFSNSVVIRDCNFNSSTGDIQTACIQNPGQGWHITGNNFELGTSAGVCNAIGQNLGGSLGVSVIGNWIGDSGTGAQTAIDINGDGWLIAGNLIGLNSNAGSMFINQRSGANGLSVQGNRLQNSGLGITFGGSNNDVAVIGNRWNGVTTRYSGSPVNGILESSTGSGGIQVFGALQRSVQSIAFAASVTPDPTLGEIVLLGTLTGGITVNNPSNSAAGQWLTIRYTQDGSGGRVLSYGGNYSTGGGAAVSTSANTTTIDRFFCETASLWRLVSRVTGQ